MFKTVKRLLTEAKVRNDLMKMTLAKSNGDDEMYNRYHEKWVVDFASLSAIDHKAALKLLTCFTYEPRKES